MGWRRMWGGTPGMQGMGCREGTPEDGMVGGEVEKVEGP